MTDAVRLRAIAVSAIGVFLVTPTLSGTVIIDGAGVHIDDGDAVAPPVSSASQASTGAAAAPGSAPLRAYRPERQSLPFYTLRGPVMVGQDTSLPPRPFNEGAQISLPPLTPLTPSIPSASSPLSAPSALSAPSTPAAPAASSRPPTLEITPGPGAAAAASPQLAPSTETMLRVQTEAVPAVVAAPIKPVTKAALEAQPETAPAAAATSTESVTKSTPESAMESALSPAPQTAAVAVAAPSESVMAAAPATQTKSAPAAPETQTKTPNEPVAATAPETQTATPSEAVGPEPTPETETTAVEMSPIAAVELPPPARNLRIVFDGAETDITESGVAELKRIAELARLNRDVRINVRAYAENTAENAAWKRRVALRRAQSVRRVLLDGGVESYRILVRAMGSPAKDDDGPTNRVDIDTGDR